MSKKTLIIGIVTFLILFFSNVIHADQHYDQYPGNGFMPQDESFSYYKDFVENTIHHDDTSDAVYLCPVNFSVPDGSTYFIKSIGMRYCDNLTDGNIQVQLRRQNLYTHATHIVASWISGTLNASPFTQTASKGTETGVKLIDTKKFVYWLHVWFYVDGDVNPSWDLYLCQVRIHYGT